MSGPNISKRSLLAGAALGAGVVLVGGAAANAILPADGARFKPRGFSRARVITTDEGPLPDQVDVAIIGGGFSGVCSALSLARRGLSVALFEKGCIAGEASGRSAGMIDSLLSPPSLLELKEYSKQRWRTLDQEIGEPTGFQQTGNTYLFTDQAGADQAAAWLEGVRDRPNGGARLLTAAEAMAMAPGITATLAGGITAPGDACAEVKLAAPGIALGARKAGAKIYQHCAVRAVERTAGRISGVVTERGTVKAQSVVIASGIWTPILAHALDLDLPMLQVWVSVASVSPFEGPAPGTVSVMGPNVGWRQQPDGGYDVFQYAAVSPVLPEAFTHLGAFWPVMQAEWGSFHPRFSPDTFGRWMSYWRERPLDQPSVFEEMRIFEPELRGPVIDAGIARLQDTMPVFQTASVRERWTGGMSITPDTKPVLSTIESMPGLVIATGLYHGLTVGPGLGDVVADLVAGNTPAVDVSQFRYERLVNGAKLDIYS